MAKTLSGVATDVQERLGDTAATVWTAAEIKRYLKEAYSLIASKTLCFWEEEFINDAASTANINHPFEEQYVPSGTTVHGVFTHTVDWETRYMSGPVYGPTNHTADWEITNEYVSFVGKAVYDLPDNLIQMERVTWDNRRIEPLTIQEIERADWQFLTQTGQPQGYAMEGDGLRQLRKWPIPEVSATGTTLNTKIEYFRKGTALSGDSSEFELPDRYVKYCRNYAMFRCLEREGPGQSLTLAAFWRSRWSEGIGRLIKRRSALLKVRPHGYAPEIKSQGGIPRPKLPWQYGEVVR